MGRATGKNFYGWLYAESFCSINIKAAKNFSQSPCIGFKSNQLYAY